MSAIGRKFLLTKNDCYKTNHKMMPKGIVVHSTGSNNPNSGRYIDAGDSIISENDCNNDWNRNDLYTCVHGFI